MSDLVQVNYIQMDETGKIIRVGNTDRPAFEIMRAKPDGAGLVEVPILATPLLHMKEAEAPPSVRAAVKAAKRKGSK